MRQLIPALSAITIFAACTPPAPGSELPSRCGPAYQELAGRNIGEFTLPPSLPHRILQPGAAMTRDYSPDRVNFFVDEKGWIQRVTCG